MTLAEYRHRGDRAFLLVILQEKDGNVSLAAREAGISRVHLHRLIVQHGLQADVERLRSPAPT